ncbi:MAG: GNAT family N-acetyltransferase [Bacteroidales bacterium]|nr:GNAT family N-acetyltransferase [Bacteroidales bacterium]
MKVNIRQEKPLDYPQVSYIIGKAFKNEIHSDHQEQILVENLRGSESYIPELALVAEIGDTIVGYILLTKLKIIGKDKMAESLALAPVCVLPDFHHQSIGSQLIEKAHHTARKMGFQSVILLGHEDYYPRFGYELTSKYGIELPFEAPEENCMIIELEKDGLKGVSGQVEYPKVFFD